MTCPIDAVQKIVEEVATLMMTFQIEEEQEAVGLGKVASPID